MKRLIIHKQIKYMMFIQVIILTYTIRQCVMYIQIFSENSFLFLLYMYIYTGMYFQREVPVFHMVTIFLSIISGFQEYVIMALNSIRNNVTLRNV